MSADKREIGVGVIGLGFMGRTHLAAYRDANTDGHACRVVGLCDAQIERFKGEPAARGNIEKEETEPLYDPDNVRFSTDPAELFSDPRVELVSICTPTDTHVALAQQALEAGKHVLVEKPLALRVDDARHLAAKSEETGRMCMPAMCMRFWPGWSWLKDTITEGTYGPVTSAVFRRIGAPPSWSPEFYANAARTGGALFDLHVHDADFVRYCFGEPAAVSSTGTLDHITTLYRYAKGEGPAHVVAEGGWDHSQGFEFFMGYTVIFEQATAIFALGAEDPLTLARDGKLEAIEIEKGAGYDGEVRHALGVLRGEGELRATCAEAADLIGMLEAERVSLTTGQTVQLAASR